MFVIQMLAQAERGEEQGARRRWLAPGLVRGAVEVETGSGSFKYSLLRAAAAWGHCS
jgi:hypothetical protein